MYLVGVSRIKVGKTQIVQSASTEDAVSHCWTFGPELEPPL